MSIASLGRRGQPKKKASVQAKKETKVKETKVKKKGKKK